VPGFLGSPSEGEEECQAGIAKHSLMVSLVVELDTILPIHNFSTCPVPNLVGLFHPVHSLVIIRNLWLLLLTKFWLFLNLVKHTSYFFKKFFSFKQFFDFYLNKSFKSYWGPVTSCVFALLNTTPSLNLERHSGFMSNISALNKIPNSSFILTSVVQNILRVFVASLPLQSCIRNISIFQVSFKCLTCN